MGNNNRGSSRFTELKAGGIRWITPLVTTSDLIAISKNTLVPVNRSFKTITV
jgi:hypothetical protein